ncbi:MAG: tRNA (cytidine(34)-2'-O)-methyltransferase [Pseudomonadota bacterium]
MGSLTFMPLLHIVLFQPDIPQNTGAILRLCACLNIALDIIEPCGFIWSDRKLHRAGLDYIELTQLKRYKDFGEWQQEHSKRLVLLTTKAQQCYWDFEFTTNDALFLGQESRGAPEWLHQKAEARLKIPIKNNTRSLNQAIAASIIASEAVRQISIKS